MHARIWNNTISLQYEFSEMNINHTVVLNHSDGFYQSSNLSFSSIYNRSEYFSLPKNL